MKNLSWLISRLKVMLSRQTRTPAFWDTPCRSYKFQNLAKTTNFEKKQLFHVTHLKLVDKKIWNGSGKYCGRCRVDMIWCTNGQTDGQTERNQYTPSSSLADGIMKNDNWYHLIILTMHKFQSRQHTTFVIQMCMMCIFLYQGGTWAVEEFIMGFVRWIFTHNL